MNFDKDLKEKLVNVHCYAVTPFMGKNEMEIDQDAFSSNLEFLINNGVKVIAIGGGTGEIEALSNSEMKLLLKTALDITKERALIVPSLPGNLSEAVDLLKYYESMNARIVMAAPPQLRWKIPENLDGIFEYYRQLSLFSNIPLMPYNTQSWPCEFFEKLAEIKSIISIKDPCLNPHEFFKAIQSLKERFIWIGNKRHDPGVVHLRYQMGMQAFTSGQSNFWPEPELEIHRLSLKKNWSKIIEIQQEIAPLEKLRLMNDDAAMVKTAMDIVGLSGGRVRAPRLNLNQGDKENLNEVIKKLKIRVT